MVEAIASDPAGQGGHGANPAPPTGRSVPFLALLLLALVVLLGASVVLAAAKLVFDNLLVFFGEHPSRREDAIVAQACVIGLWGVGSVVGVSIAGIGRGRPAVIAAAWTAALLATTPWRWLPPPSASEGDDGDVPMWFDGSTRPLVWGLAVLGAASGVSLAWQNGRTARIVAGSWAALLVLLLAVSGVELQNIGFVAR